MSLLLPARRRPRLPLQVYADGHVFFITIATAFRGPWFERSPSLAGHLEGIIEDTAAERDALLYAWCIMPEHCHLLVQDYNLVAFVRLVKGRTTPMARHILPRGVPLWQKSFYDHAVRRDESLCAIARYVFENPVRRGIAASPGSYRWSGSNVWPDWEHLFGRG